MLHGLENDGCCVSLKLTVEDRGMERQRKDVRNLLYSQTNELFILMSLSMHTQGWSCYFED